MPDTPKDCQEEFANYISSIVEVVGQRNDTHGSFYDQHNLASKLARAYFSHVGFSMTPRDVAIFMILIKLSRIATGDNLEQDHYRDIIGYAAIAGLLAKEEAEQGI